MTLRRREVMLWLVFLMTAVFVLFSTTSSAEAKGGRVRNMTKEETVEFYLDQYDALRKESRLFPNREKMEEMQIQLFDAIGGLKDIGVKDEYYQQMGRITDKYNRTRKMMKLAPIMVIIAIGAVVAIFITVKRLNSDYELEDYDDTYDYEDDEYDGDGDYDSTYDEDDEEYDYEFGEE